MNEKERKAIENNQFEVVDTISKLDYKTFLNFLWKEKVIAITELKSFQTLEPDTQSIKVLERITIKDSGFSALINYLKEHGCQKLAEKLTVAASGNIQACPITKTSTTDMKTNFISKLKTYYKEQYTRVSKIRGLHDGVNEVWVPIRIVDITSNLDKNKSVDHMKFATDVTVASVHGHPGSGKTTLIKKIAYDWADKKIGKFKVIFVIELRYAESMTDFLKCATSFYAEKLGFLNEEPNLLSWLTEIASEVLICFDGLEEYKMLSESPFKSIFEPFWNARKTTDEPKVCPPPFLPYRIIITSTPRVRDYIIENVNLQVFEISPLNRQEQKGIVQHYCKPGQSDSVYEYIKMNSDWVRNPLLLMLIISLSNPNFGQESIQLSNLTLLYETVLDSIIQRALRENKLHGDINNDEWKDKVFETAAKVAFEVCRQEKSEFPRSDVDTRGDAAKDIFTCGFLLDKRHSRSSQIPMAEFIHRSVQEFFAAFHCCKIFSDERLDRNFVVKEILKRDSNFGRFFLGIFSQGNNFEKMLEWLKPTIAWAESTSYDFTRFLSFSSVSLSDCRETDAKMFGKQIAVSLNELESYITEDRKSRIILNQIFLPCFNKGFQNGLNHCFLNEAKRGWSIRSSDQERCSLLTYICFDAEATFDKFDKIQVLIWEWDCMCLSEMASILERLPHVSTLVVKIHGHVDVEINVNLNYESNPTISPPLKHLKFSYGKLHIQRLKKFLPDSVDTNALSISENDERESIWFTVKVSKDSKKTPNKLVNDVINLAFNKSIKCSL